jgi:hypothetical protein
MLEIQNVVRNEQNLGSNMHVTLAERAPIWRKEVNDAESQASECVATVLEAAKEAQAKQQDACLLD